MTDAGPVLIVPFLAVNARSRLATLILLSVLQHRLHSLSDLRYQCVVLLEGRRAAFIKGAVDTVLGLRAAE